MYLALEGHLPEMFLLTELMGRTEEEARKIIRWQREQQLYHDPAVRAIRVVAERRRLRKLYKLPAVENEEASIEDDGTRVSKVISGQVTIDPDGQVRLNGEGIENLPPEIQQLVRTEIGNRVRQQAQESMAEFFKKMGEQNGNEDDSD